MENNVIQQTTDYSQFKIISTNRDAKAGHVEKLKEGFAKFGNLTKVQPILVNEKFEIIDGQHRFLATEQLGEPVYYTMQPGLGIAEARSMNILHRSWTTDDYAQSYARAGDRNYIRYLAIKEDFGFSHSVVLRYIGGVEKNQVWREFRNGDFTMTPEQEVTARDRLTHLGDAAVFVPFAADRNFAFALLKAMTIENYDSKRMLKKIELHKGMMHREGSVEAYLRMLEEVYNFQMSEPRRQRLY